METFRYAGAIAMALSKIFDTINHELPLAKLYTYGFSKHSLLVLCNFFAK